MDEDFAVIKDLTLKGRGRRDWHEGSAQEAPGAWALKSSELQPLQWLFGHSGDVGLNEGTRKTSIVFISKIMFVQRRVVG